MAEKMSDEDKIEKFPDTVKVVYTEAPDYKVIYANGVYGGVTGREELRFDLFQEYHQFPNEEQRKINEDGTIGDPIPNERDSGQLELIRERQVGIVIPISFAETLHRWLGERIEAYKGIKTKIDEERKNE